MSQPAFGHQSVTSQRPVSQQSATSRSESILEGSCLLEWVCYFNRNLVDAQPAHIAGQLEVGGIRNQDVHLIGGTSVGYAVAGCAASRDYAVASCAAVHVACRIEGDGSGARNTRPKPTTTMQSVVNNR